MCSVFPIQASSKGERGDMDHIGDSIDKSLIKKRRKKFFAMIIGLMIGIMPTVNVWAERTITFDENDQLVGGNTIKAGDSIYHTALTVSGGYKIDYKIDGAWTDSDPVYTGNQGFEIEVTNQELDNLKHWSIDYSQDGGYYIFKLTPVFNPDPTPEEPTTTPTPNPSTTTTPAPTQVPTTTPAPVRPEAKDAGEDKSNEEASVINHNPDALNSHYYLNGMLNDNYSLGKTEQSLLGQIAFNAARPKGWNKAFSMSMSYKGRNEYSKKEGTIVLYIPEAYQKKGRKYAIMAIDKSGNVSILEDTDIYPYLVTVTPGLEGYAYELIYSD